MSVRKLNGASVRVIRELTGISLTDLAARVGIAKATLSNVERGIHGTNPETDRKLAEAMGVPLESITYPVAAPQPEPVAVAS
jgi:transcriptional regulator with XRE-family HTH domain